MSPPTRILITRGLLLLCLATLAFTSCSKPLPSEPFSKQEALGVEGSFSKASGFGSGSFYPLTVGNTWTYEGSADICHFQRGSNIGNCLGFPLGETRRLIGTIHHRGIPFVIEEQVFRSGFEGSQDSTIWWSLLRQDRSGLFAADTLLRDPPAIDAARPLGVIDARAEPFRFDDWVPIGFPDPFHGRIDLAHQAVRGFVLRVDGPPPASGPDLRLLVYPLAHGTNWSIRPDFPWPARVDGVEALDTSAGRFTAYRIAVNPLGTTVGPGEWIHVWYSRQGYLGHSIRLASPRIGADGQPTGDIDVFYETLKVTSIHVTPSLASSPSP